MAENVVNLVAKRLENETGKSFRPCQTKHYPISGGDVGGSANLGAFIAKKAEEGQNYGFSKEEGAWLARRYGSNVDQLFRYGKQYEENGETRLSRPVYAQLMYAIEHEMAVKPVDFFIRRTGALYFDIDWVRSWKEEVIRFMGQYSGWSESRRAEYTEQLNKEMTDAVTPADLQ
jgi:glycerol-3-phosphate dehydrogenase